MKGYRDNTSARAVGSVDNEWKYMARLAVKLRSQRHSPQWEDETEAKFTGIFRRLLTDPIEEVKKEARR